MTFETLEAIDTEQAAHAILSPSSAHRWKECLGTILLSKDMPSKTSEYAEEGTLYHDYIARIRTAHFSNKSVKKILDEVEDEEMAHHLEQSYEFTRTLQQKFLREDDKKIQIYIEERVKLTKNIWGTLDFGMLVQRAGKTDGPGRRVYDLVIVDDKYGKGVKVSAVENIQLLTYALAIDKEHAHGIRNIYLYVFQPRVGGDKPFSRWQPDRAYLQKVYSELVDVERKHMQILAGQREAEFKTGEHCRFCLAAGKCPALKAELEKEDAMQLDVLEEHSKPKKRGKKNVDNFPALIPKVPVEQLVQIFDKKKLIEHYLESVERYLMTLLEQGEKVPGYKLVKSRTRRMWQKDVDKVGEELIKIGVSHPYRKSLVTIGEVEREIGKGKIDHLTETSEAKLQLAKEDDERDAVDFTGAVDLLDTIPF